MESWGFCVGLLVLHQDELLLPGAAKSATDYTRYFKRFGSSLECGSLYCKDMNYREHFHCTVPMCKDKVRHGVSKIKVI